MIAYLKRGDVKMFLELGTNSTFKQNYFEMLKYRLAYGSLELEGEMNGDLASPTQSIKIFNQLNAINYIFETKHSDKLSHFEFTNLLCKIAELVSGGEINNFRTTDAMVKGSKVERTKPQMIRNDLWYLIDDYNYQIDNCNNEYSLFEIEALFHIRLLHIHPFEDANGRTARIILAYNMCKHNLAPCVITKERKKEYCDYIENFDYKGLAKLFEALSKQELETMVALYRKMDDEGLIESNKMTKEQEEEYKRIRGI